VSHAAALRIPTTTPRTRLVLILGGLAAFGPLSFDMYLPAFPELRETFGASASAVQLTLTAGLLGLGLGQLVAGPMSDALGRRGPLLAGLAGYVCVSLLCAVAPSIEALVGLRFLQGLTAAAGVVMSRAIVRDVSSGVAMARLFSLLMLVNGLAPVLAPTIGSAVLGITSWRGIFVVLAGFGLVLLGVASVGLPETLPAERRRDGGLRTTMHGFATLLRDRTFVGYGLTLGLSIGSVFAYIAGSSFALQDVYGLSPGAFALSFGVNGVGIVACSQANRFLLQWFAPRRLLVGGLAAMSCGAVALLAVVASGTGLPWALCALFVSVASVGFVMPNATALALASHAGVAGSASALLGVNQFLVGAVAAPLVGIAGVGTAVPMALVMTLLCLGAALALATLTRPALRRELSR
jgi:DHA1 family bicyclomycin/chloramphenicol resistance-like MFS transporter